MTSPAKHQVRPNKSTTQKEKSAEAPAFVSHLIYVSSFPFGFFPYHRQYKQNCSGPQFLSSFLARALPSMGKGGDKKVKGER
jgi:hypothetical protein